MIGQKIYYFRKSKGLTQEQLAHGICSISHLSKIENGHETPSDDTLAHLCNRLEIDLNDIDTSEDQNAFSELLDDWYSLMMNKERAEVIKLFPTIQNQIDKIQDPALLLKYKLYHIRYVLMLQQLEVAAQELRELKEYYRNFSQEMKYYYNFIYGVYYYLNSDYTEALKYLQKTEELSIELRFKDPEMLYLLALTHSQLQDITLSIHYTSQALDMFNHNFQFIRSLECEVLLGINSRRIQNDIQAEKHFLNALKVAKSLKHDDLVCINYHNLGVLYLKKDSQKSIHYFLESLKYVHKKTYLREEEYVRTCLGLAEAYYHLQDFREMRSWLKRGEREAIAHNFTSFILQFKVLRCRTDEYSDEEKKNILKNEVLPHFIAKKKWICVAEYAELLAELYNKNNKYKNASHYYKLVIEVNKKLQKI